MPIDGLVDKIKNVQGFDNVKFILLYGSTAEGRETSDSDIDVCIHYEGNDDEAESFRFKVMSELMDDKIDVHIFHHLPLYIQVQVLKGKVLFSEDKQFLYDTAYDTIKQYQDFRHRYYDYIGMGEIK